MKKIKFYSRIGCFLLIGFSFVAHSNAVTPMEYYNSLVAGGFESGYRDGSFVKAYFSSPAGIVFDPSGEKIYVADLNNNRIRVVDLAHQNAVETVAGTGAGGNLDGPIEKATFNAPRQLAVLPDNRLAVYDSGNSLIRLIDMKAKTVSTIAHGVMGWDMLYRPQDDSLYLSEPDSQSLVRLDLQSMTVVTVFSKNTKILSPQALCLNGDKLLVSDHMTNKVYEVSLPAAKNMDQKEISFKEVGQGENILELSESDGVLYGLQSGTVSLVRISSPASIPVQLATNWGFFVEGKHEGVEPFFGFKPDQAYGFAASPKESRKFYITRPNIGLNAIVSVKDYDFNKSWIVNHSSYSADNVTDFDYPALKPARTYRILLMGDSRTTLAIRDKADVGDKADGGSGTFRTDTLPKQLEFFLNVEANLRDVDTHFEVLTLSRPDKTFSSYVESDVTPLVKKYDVDLVLGLAGEADVKKGELDSTIYSLGLLSKAMQSFKISSGLAPKLAFLYVPSPVFKNDITEPLWKDLCTKSHLTFIDLTETFDTLKTSYYPTAQKGTTPAYTAYGSELVANLLSRYLEDNQVVPFEAVKK